MKRYEYMLVELHEPLQTQALVILNSYGGKGWEAYAVTRCEAPAHHGGGARAWSTFHMRREVQS